MKRVNCLLRVSSKQQLRGDDIPVQRTECMEYINKNPEWKFQKEYLEKAVSGFKTSLKDRGVLREILEDARNKAFDVLVVYMSDRIGRKEDESPFFVTTLNNLGVEVWSVKEGQLKTEEHIDKLLNYLRFWHAEGESMKTAARVRDAQETFVKKGKFVGGYAPFGYRLEYSGAISNHGRALKELVVDKEKADIVRKIFNYTINYNYGDLKIAKVLNEQNILAPRDTWKACTIAQILQNPIYKGYVTYNRRQRSRCGGKYERIPMENWILSENQNQALTIVSEEIWNKAQEMREKRKAMIKKSMETSNHDYTAGSAGKLVLMGLVYCGYCGCRLTNGSKYDYWTTKDGEHKKKFVGRYRCTSVANGSLSCQGKPYYRSEEIEPMVYTVVTSYLNQLREADTQEDILKLQEEQKLRVKMEKESLGKEQKTIQKDIATLKENIPAALRGEGVFGVQELSALLKEKEQRLSELQQLAEKKEKEYEELKLKKKDINEIGEIISNWGELFIQCSIPEQKVMLSKIIERIDIWEDEIKIKFRISKEEYRKSTGSDTTPYIPCSA